MGLSTSSDIVPYVIHNVWYNSNPSIQDVGVEFFAPGFAFEDGVDVRERTGDWQFLSAYPLDMEEYDAAEERGETLDYLKIDKDKLGKRERIWVSYAYKKGDKIVYLLNESPYESGGAYDMSLIADTREALTEFVAEVLEANKIPLYNTKIEESDTVQQTI